MNGKGNHLQDNCKSSTKWRNKYADIVHVYINWLVNNEWIKE